MEDTTGARIVQRKKRREILPPLLIPDGLYNREIILNNLGISTKTFAAWEKRGLPTASPQERKKYLFGHEVMEFIKQNRNGKGG